ncbi:hypothetical protein BC831DRAFT_297083 [Entophlyctis helioformis]|nr:hypothetical protein BC831DRAFT_297083 [Entophlyctis helioformis]
MYASMYASLEASIEAYTANSLVARLLPADDTDAAIADAVNAWRAVKATEHSYSFDGPESALFKAGLSQTIILALSHPSSLVKVAALQVAGRLARNDGYRESVRTSTIQNLGSIIIGLLLDNDTSVANTVLETASDSLWCFWVSENSSLFTQAIEAQTERHMILNLLGAIRRRNVGNNLWDDRHRLALLDWILRLLEMDEEVAADAATCIPFFVPSDASESNDMHVVLAIINKLKESHKPRHQLALSEALYKFLDRNSRQGLVQRAVKAGILDALDAFLARRFAAIYQHRELVHSVFRIVVLIISQGDLPISSTALPPIFTKLISFVGHQDKELSKTVLKQLHEPIRRQDPIRPNEHIRYVRSTSHAAIIARYLQHGIIPALLRNIKHSGIGDGTAVEMLHTLLTEFADKPENPVAVKMEAIGFPAVLQGVIGQTYVDDEMLEKLLEIMDKHFPKHFKTANPSILPNKNSTGLPKSLIPGMEQWYLTLKEREYLVLRATILNKPLWWTKFTDATIAAQWRDEAAAPGVTQRALSLLFSELEYLAEHEIRTVKLASGDAVTVTPGAVKCTTMSDDAVPESLRDALIRQVAVLEDVPDHKKDWHPGSDGKVLDLVHPSLYPLVYGRSLVLSLDDRATATSTPPWDLVAKSECVSGKPTFGWDANYMSKRFQWLPSELRVHDNGTVSINSYINNLHPIWSNSLYKTIAKVFERFVPLFETLFGYRYSLELYIDDPESLYMTSRQLLAFETMVDDLPDDDDDEAYEAAVDVVDMAKSDEIDVDDEDYWNGFIDSGYLQPRLPATFSPKRRVAPVSLRGHNLQVIVKLANIHLTPEKPEYGGDDWHIEGAANESIAATGIYYYDMANITEPRLAFRTIVNTEDPPFDYELGEYMYYEEVYGGVNEKPGEQDLGSIQASHGRCIAFPNSWLNKAEPFKLADPSKPGHCKTLVFFLVDPTKRVVSTAHVAPQQQHWHETGVIASRLPPELGLYITPHIPGAMSTAESHAVRARLMKERSGIDDERMDDIGWFRLFEARNTYY